MPVSKRLLEIKKFQKTLELAARASNQHEAAAAEVAARKLMAAYKIDPVAFPDQSWWSQINLADTPLFQKLRKEWREAHPDYYYSKPDRDGYVRRLKRKPRPKPVNTKPESAKPVNTKLYAEMLLDAEMFDGFTFAVNTKPKPKPTAKPKPVNTTSSDRNRDRHSPGYMRDYMRRRRAAQNRGHK